MTILALAAPARAGFIQESTNTLDHLAAGATLVASGFTFSDFDVSNIIGTGGAIPPNPADIMVIAGHDDAVDAVGLRFLLSLNAASSQTTSINFEFLVTAPLLSGRAFSDLSLLLTSAQASGNALVSVNETVFNGPIGVGTLVVSAMGVANQAGTNADTLTDTDNIWPEALSQILVKNAITVTGGLVGTAQASQYDEYFGHAIVPEPATLTLGALGGLMLLAMCRVRRR